MHDQNKLYNMAREMMDSHGLKWWRFSWNEKKKQLGVCDFASTQISISLPIVMMNPIDQFVDTVLHEIAHAKAGSRAGHGPKWKAMARQLGCKAQRCADYDVALPEGRYVGTCPNCNRKLHRHRKTKRMYRLACGQCCKGKYNPLFKFQWEMEKTNE